MSETKPKNLAECDRLLLVAEQLERDINMLAKAMPPGVSNTERYISKTASCSHVIVCRLNTIYNAIRRYDHA